MALFPNPTDAIFAAIEALNDVTLVEGQYSLTNPTPFTDPSGLTNTTLTLTATSSDSPYTGSVAITYSRLDLADLSVLLPLPMQMNGLTSNLQVALAMNALFGLNFTTADIVDGDLTVGSDGSGEVTLVAQTGSLGWMGSVTLPFIEGNFDLAAGITQPNLPGLLYPDETVSPTKPFGEYYSYWQNFSAQSSVLAAITTDTTDLTTLAAALTAVTGNAWSASAAGRYSVQNAIVAYNGTTVGQTEANPNYSDVCIVTLDATASLGYSGQLFLHYTPPD